jgi:uncharacterized GH25 family protein
VPANLDPARVLRGRVVDPAGEPVVGAVVSVSGCKTESMRWWGAVAQADPLSVTNAKGQYVIVADKDVQALDLKVDARGLVPENIALLPMGQPAPDIKLSEGAIVSGRIMRDGKPVAGIGVGMVQKDRSSERFLGQLTIGTDADGRFTFSNVGANRDWYVYGLMASTKSLGAPKTQLIHVDDNRTVSNVGDLEFETANTVSGRVVLSDGKPVPPHTRILLSRELAWDSQSVTIDERGGFTFTNVPAELVSLSVRVRGYRTSVKNQSADMVNLGMLVGLVDGNINDLTILLEPGDPQSMSVEDSPGGATHWRDLRKNPLRATPTK